MAVKINEVMAYFDRTSDQFLSREEFKVKLRSGKPLRIKYGVDVRTPTLHIGHAVNLWLMRYLQDRGHKVVFVIGDFTTRIGDPDGRLDTCCDIPTDEVEKNIATFIEQARMVLRFDDPKLIEVRRNSEWYDKMPLREFMDLASLVTHARLMARDMFQLRLAQGREIYVQEMLYPILQGYDSLVVESDLAIVGSDQFFNESIGRILQEKHGKKPQTLITTKITPGTDGRGKQSKSMGNYIGLLHSPRDKFGRIMSIPDHLIEEYFRVYTDVPYSEISGFKAMIGKKPRDAKVALATALVERYHGTPAAELERDWFENTISRGQVPDNLPTLGLVSPKIDAFDLVQMARPGKSKSDTKRLMQQGGVELNGKKLKDPDQKLVVSPHEILKVGKRNWFRIEIVKLNALTTKGLNLSPMMPEDIDFMVKYVPNWEMVKHLDKEVETKKPSVSLAREAFKKLVLSPEPRHDWLWKIADKKEPEKILGLAHLRRDGQRAEKNVWLTPEGLSREYVLSEALMAVNEHAFAALGLNALAFKDAFAFATAPKDLDVLQRSMITMEASQLNREDAFGTVGFTNDGWDMLQAWRRTMSPWLFQNAPKSPAQQAQELKQDPPAPPKPAPKSKVKNPFEIEMTGPKPKGSGE